MSLPIQAMPLTLAGVVRVQVLRLCWQSLIWWLLILLGQVALTHSDLGGVVLAGIAVGLTIGTYAGLLEALDPATARSCNPGSWLPRSVMSWWRACLGVLLGLPGALIGILLSLVLFKLLSWTRVPPGEPVVIQWISLHAGLTFFFAGLSTGLVAERHGLRGLWRHGLGVALPLVPALAVASLGWSISLLIVILTGRQFGQFVWQSPGMAFALLPMAVTCALIPAILAVRLGQLSHRLRAERQRAAFD